MIDVDVLQKIGAAHKDGITEEDLIRCRMSVAEVYEGQTFLMSYKNRSLLSKGDIVAVKGRAKAGKTHFLAVLIATLLRGKYAEFRSLESGLSILHIDTEQGLNNFQAVIKKALRMAGLPDDQDHEKLLTFNLRDFLARDRLAAVAMLADAYCPDVLIIDGVRDLLSDFNDIGQSSEVINFLMALSKQRQCAIITVLHENKADNNMRGHLGTELLNKCSEVYQVQRSGNDERSYFKVTQTDTRNLPVEDFTFEMGEDGLPVEVAIDPPLSSAEKRRMMLVGNLDRFMQPGTSMSYSDFISTYMEVSGLAESTAKKHLPEALDLGILIKNGDEYCRRIYMG